MEEFKNLLYNMLRVVFKGKDAQHSELIKQAKIISKNIEKNILHISLSPEDKEAAIDMVINQYEMNIGVVQPNPSFLSDGEPGEWFLNEKDNNSFEFFSRYCEYLRDDAQFSDSTIDKIKLSTESILSYCANPKGRTSKENQKKRGLVVGDVQSGKTANYIALINMACDVGYNIVVLLAGMTSILRQQTQDRIDSGFIGAKSDTISNIPEFVGVGVELKRYFGIPLTNHKNDFVKYVKENQNAGAQDFNKPIVLVVKKNKSILNSVSQWLKPGLNNIQTSNILIIDDEADNASVNTRKDINEISAINECIRKIYNNFPIASYVGYTATPFANIFINPFESSLENQDLFPANFIELLETPSNYFGFDKVFEKDSNDNYLHIQLINESDVYNIPALHKRDYIVKDLPDDLIESIYHFYLVNCIRTLRGDTKKHRSMLINVTRFNDVQYELFDLVERYHNNFVNLLEEINSKISRKPGICSASQKLFELYLKDKTFSKARREFSWKDICRVLLHEAKQIVIRVINNKTKKADRFNYDDYKEDGARAIIIGGFVLSRGLTLEGLVTSYFSRNGSAYDSMLQMSRWFGYRFNYDDICKIYMTEENLNSFDAINEAVEDLKTQFRRMALAHKTPREFGLMVKERPEALETSLLITARNKMYNAKQIFVTTDFSGYGVDTSKIFKSNEANKTNFNAILKFYNKLFEEGKKFENYSKPLIKNVDKDHIVELIDELEIPMENLKFDQYSLTTYLKESNVLPSWDVVIATGIKVAENEKFNFFEQKLNPVTRSFKYNVGEKYYRISGDKNRLYEPSIFGSGLSDDEIKQAKEKRSMPIAADYLDFPNRHPLLVIYPVKLKTDNQDEMILIDESQYNNAIYGFAIGFPKTSNGIRVKYRANKIKIQEIVGDLDTDDEGYDWDNDED